MLGLVIAILTYLIVVSLLFAANTTVFSLVTSNPARLKSIIRDSGAYDRAGNVLIEQAASQQAQESNLLLNPDIKKIAAESIDKKVAEKQTNGFIDGTYAWLQGKTAEPEFTLSLAEAQTNFIDQTALYLEKRLATLPPCNTFELPQPGRGYDVLNATCRPPINIDATTIKNELSEQLRSQPDSFMASRLSAKDFTTPDGQNLFASIKRAPEVFSLAKWLPLITLLIAILAGAGILMLNDDKKRALLTIGLTALASSALLLATPYAIAAIISSTVENSPQITPAVSKLFLPVLLEFNSQTAYVYRYFALGTFLAGLVVLAARSRHAGDQSGQQSS